MYHSHWRGAAPQLLSFLVLPYSVILIPLSRSDASIHIAEALGHRPVLHQPLINGGWQLQLELRWLDLSPLDADAKVPHTCRWDRRTNNKALIIREDEGIFPRCKVSLEQGECG